MTGRLLLRSLAEAAVLAVPAGIVLAVITEGPVRAALLLLVLCVAIGYVSMDLLAAFRVWRGHPTIRDTKRALGANWSAMCESAGLEVERKFGPPATPRLRSIVETPSGLAITVRPVKGKQTVKDIEKLGERIEGLLGLDVRVAPRPAPGACALEIVLRDPLDGYREARL
ncbi:MAG: hypothetical protein MR522_07975 [Trueperella sp.]|uniref:hypothetical protein n=1 Tax=Trueperella sp. TaxID=2699835 RepID=UPI0025E19FE1|nr:hypothetical protein [Trueperella sp.]MCI7306180.1 hypothetical protein [Trueperella sp.]